MLDTHGSSRGEAALKIAPLPKDEQLRIQALRALEILDTPAEERFDRITRIAQHYFDVPIALVSMVDVNRQWFKSHLGVDATETPRDMAFCAHAILQPAPLVVENALEDVRFHDNPLVTGEVGIRFYAGRRLFSQDGYPVGTLCIIDRRPREMTQSDLQVLDDLAVLVEQELGRIELTRTATALSRREADLRDFFENANDLIQSLDRSGKVLFANRTWRETLGYDQEDLDSLTFWDVLHPSLQDHCRRTLAEVFEGQSMENVQVVLIAKNGTLVHASGNVSLATRDDGTQYTRGIFRNITRQQEMLHELRESEERFRQVAENMRDVFWSVSTDNGAPLYVSPAYAKVWGRDTEALKENPHDWLAGIHPEDREGVLQRLQQAAAGGQRFDMEYRVVRPDGAVRFIHDRREPVLDKDGRLYRLAGIATDVTERKQLELELQRLALTDELTGLSTMRLFKETLQHELARSERNRSPVSVAMIDLDWLKRINDDHGHAAGDAALRHLAQCMRRIARKSDQLARYAGDEFCILLPDTDRHSAASLLDRLRRTLQEDLVRAPGVPPFRVTCSVGVVQWGGTEDDELEDLMKLADRALYCAKSDGRNCVSVLPSGDDLRRERERGA